MYCGPFLVRCPRETYRERKKVLQIMVPAALSYVGSLHIQVLDDQLENTQRNTRLVQEACCKTHIPLFQLLFDLIRNITGIFILQVQFGIPGYFNTVTSFYLLSLK